MTPEDLGWAAVVDVATCIVLVALFWRLRGLPRMSSIYWPVLAERLKQADHAQDQPALHALFPPDPGARWSAAGDRGPYTGWARGRSGGFGRWVRGLWEASEHEIVSEAGLDAAAFVRLHTFALQLFSIAGLAAGLVILPTNYTGQSGLPEGSSWDMQWTMSHLKAHSPRLWVHVGSAWALSLLTMHLLHAHTLHLLHLRMRLLNTHPRLKRAIQHYSVVVRDILGTAKPAQGGVGDQLSNLATGLVDLVGVDGMLARAGSAGHPAADRTGVQRSDLTALFSSIYPQSLLQCTPVPYVEDVWPHWRRLHDARCRVEEHYRQKEDGWEEEQQGCASLCGMWGRGDRGSLAAGPGLTASLLGSPGELEEALEGLERALDEARARALDRPVNAALLTFRTRQSASQAVGTLFTSNGLAWSAEPAPAPSQIYWPSLHIRWWQQVVRCCTTSVIMVFVYVFFMVPVGFVASLAAHMRADTVDPPARWLHPLGAIIDGYTPSLVLALFMAVLPWVLTLLVRWDCRFFSQPAMHHSVASGVFGVLVCNVFFGSVLTISVFKQLRDLRHFDMEQLVKALGTYIPTTSVFFLSFVLFLTCNHLPLELLKPWPALCRLAGAPPPTIQGMSYSAHLPNASLVVLIGLVFTTVAPLVLLGIVPYFALARFVWIHQLTQVYASGVETDSGGQLWIVAVRHVMAGLVVAQLTLLGVLVLKASPLTAVLLPLPPVTLAAVLYFHRKFADPFRRVPLSCCVQDDREGNLAVDFAASSYMSPCMRDDPGASTPTDSAPNSAVVSGYHHI